MSRSFRACLALMAIAALAFTSRRRVPPMPAQMEANKKTVAAFYDAALNKKDFEEASKYLGARATYSTIRRRRTASRA